jgi:putative ABC transport system permease protein
LSLSRFLAGLLYGVKSNDPMTLAAVSLLLLVSALAATLMPARRAMRVDPMVALRYE